MKKLKLSLTEGNVTVNAETTLGEIAKHAEVGLDTFAILMSEMQTKLDIETMTDKKFNELCLSMSKEQLISILFRHRYSLVAARHTKLITELNTIAYYENQSI